MIGRARLNDVRPWQLAAAITALRAAFPHARVLPQRHTVVGCVDLVGACGFALVLAACASVNTPQQDLAYARWAKCNASLFPLELERVDLDGRIAFRFAPNGQEVWQCLIEASPTGPPLPEPVGVCPPKSP